jgi:carbohydrate diacid regulator
VAHESTLLYWCRAAGKERDDALLLEQFDEQGWPMVRMATVEPSADLDTLRQACSAARDLLDYARHVQPQQRLLRLATYRLAVLFWRHRNDWLALGVAEPIVRLRDSNNGQLLETLRCWFDYSGESQACADALGVHRNSLRYRLEKVAELSGCDPYKTDDLLRLYLGVQMTPRLSVG